MEREGSQQPPGTELAARREMLPAELVAPNRAGAIVAEFVNSIVEEAQARALEMIRAAAEQDDAGQREALESADRMRARIETMAEELEAAVGQLRQESARLAALHEQTTLASITGTTVGADTAEREALAQVAASLQRGEEAEAAEPRAEEPEGEETHEVEVVAGHEEDEAEAEADDDHEGLPEEAVEGHAEEELDEEPATAAAHEPSAEAQPAHVDAEAAAEPEAEAHDARAAAEVLDAEAAAEPEMEAPDELPRVEAEAPVEEVEPGPEERLGTEEGPRADVQPALEQEEPGPEERLGLVEEDEPGPEERLGLEPAGPPEDEPPEDEAAPEEPEVIRELEPEGEGDAEPAGETEALSDEDELAQDQERFARMDDADLARAYSDALDQMDTQPADTPRGARLLRYAGSALGEALTRPTFADIGQGPPALEPVPRMGRRRRRRAEAINTLRRACTQAIEEMSAEEAVR